MTENIVYHQNFYDSIREAKDEEELRGILRKVETEIKERVGNNHYEFYSKASNEEKEAIEELLGTRSFILNQMFERFSATPDEVKLFEKVNSLLDKLTKQMYKRTTSLYRSFLASCRDNDFDDDYEVEGVLTCNLDYDCNEEENDTVLTFDNDDFYGSDFSYMIPLVSYMEEEMHGSFGKEINSCHVYHKEDNTPNMTDEELDCYDWYDDGTTWAEGCLCVKELEHIKMCYAVHSICTHHEYAIPDLLRMTDFWVEVKIVCQHNEKLCNK